jgi:hypothetical protein
MSMINQQLKSLLPQLAGPISTLLASMPKQRGRSGLLPSAIGVAGAGVLVGVAIGLLLAPQTGRDMRRQLVSAASSFRDEVTASLEKIAASEKGERPDAARVSEPETTRGNGTGSSATRRSNKPARA